MKKVMFVFAISAAILAVATVKAEGAVEETSAQEPERVTVVEENIPEAVLQKICKIERQMLYL